MFFQSLITLPMMVCLFWGIFFLIRSIFSKEDSRNAWMLMIFYLVTTVLYTNHWLFFSGYGSFVGEWTYSISNLCVYPLYYAYLHTLTRTRMSLEIGLLLAPACIIAFVFPLNYYLHWNLIDPIHVFIRGCFAIQVVWVWIRGSLVIRATRIHMDDTYSDDRSYLLQPMNVLLQLFGITAAMSMALNVIGREFFTEGFWVIFPAVIMSMLLYGLGYIAAHTTIPAETVEKETSSPIPNTQEEENQLIYTIDKVMREKMLYTNPTLTIADLALEVNSNRTYVSQSINRTYGINFSQYIARQRIAYAQLLLQDPRYKTDHEAIADAIALSGFSSDTSFYRAFKDLTGLTPLQYRHQN